MADDADITKLPLEDRLGHKVWKARLSGYEELVKIYRKIDDESSNEFNKYLGMLKKFVIDNNAVAQEKGLEAVLAFLEAASPSISGRVAGDLIAGVVTKCLNARPKTKEKGINIILMYIEVEKQDVVQEEVLKGLENKQPKIVAACTGVLRQAISEFGGKVFSLKPIVKVLPKLFDHNDKMVREEAKTLAIEIYKWIRDILKQQLQNIKPVQLKELEEEWGKLPPTPPAPTRFTRTQQQKMAEQAPVAQVAPDGDVSATDGGVAVPEQEAIDPYDLIEAVEILSNLPKDFYENLENKKWQARKEALEALEKLASNPKLEGGQYGELLGSLKKIISKDANVIVVVLAAKCIGLLATGLRKKFSQYSSMITTPILEKFKEKKTNVVAALREAIDAVFLTTTFSAMQEDILATLENKNPSVKEETVRFLVRSFSKSTPAAMPKTFLKPVCSSLLKRMDDTVAPVRDATAEALGTLLKVMGERPLNPYIEQLDKIKMDKVKECAEKAEVSAVPMSAASKPASAGTTSTDGAKKEAAPAKKPASKPSKPGGKAADSAKPSSASSGPSKKKPSTSTASSAGGKAVKGGKNKGSTAANDSAEPTEPEMSPEEVDAKAAELISEAVLNQLVHANWKERLAGIEALTELIKGKVDPKTTSSQVLIRVLAKKPGWKDTNFQVLKAKFALCQYVAQNIKSFSKRSAFYALDGLVDKIGDIKLKEASKETLTTFAEVISLNYISLKVSKHAGSQKNPKVLAESLNWLSDAVKGFGFKIDLKPHIAYVKEALANTNPAVRTAAISLLGTLHMYVGATLRVFFEEEKPALLQQIDAEFERVKDEKPPAPTLGLSPNAGDTEEGGEDTEDGGGGGGEGNAAPTVNLADLVPRNDISAQITSALITELGDKNWKVRGEALQKVIDILSAAKFITPELGELPPALKARLGDSNKNLVTITLNICTTLATAMGAQINRHLKVLGTGIFSTLADAKNTVRATGIAALNAWHKEIGLTPFIEGEVIFGALSTENPNLRTEVLGWLEEKLPAEKNLPSTLVAIVAPLYSCLEDRSGDVRKKAQAVVPVMMQHVGWDAMSKQANKLKPASKSNVVTILEKARASLPEPSKAPNKAPAAAATAKPAAAKAQADSSATSGGSGGASGASASSSGGNANKKTKSTAKQAESKSSKKSSADVESDGPPFLRYNGKDGRFKDEKDLKVLKWNFTAPRAEFVEQLKEQMRPCLGKTLHSNLFHADFKYHLIGINTMQQCVVPPSDAPYQVEVVQSLDLILKWVTLRFFDTNTTVLIKCLELMDAVFVMLAQADYQMLEFEASSFIPYLVQKVGDPKDAIRKMIRNLFKLLTKIYPASKLFNYVMEGLPSKNSKTRMECLEELGSLIQVYGMNVCQPTPPKALAAIAAQIGDRDNGVRNAALNAVVEAYFLVGEKTCYKYCSQLSDKDLAYLEERIKRSSKNRPSTAPSENTAKSSVSARGGSDSSANAAKKKEDKRPGKPQLARPATAPAQRQENVRREFSLDIDGIEGDDVHHDVTVPTLEANDTLDDLISAPVKKPYTKNPTSPHMGVFSRTNPTAAFNYVISQIASGDVTASTQALVQFEKVIRNKNHKEVSKHIDQFLNAASLQLNMILTTHIPNIESNQQPEATVLRLINCLTDTMLGVFSSPALARAVSRSSLKQLMQVLITVLSDDRLAALEDGPQILRAINVLMVKVIEMSDQTFVLGSLIKLLQDCLKLLQESAGNSLSSPKFLELVMKCLWKVVRNLPKTISEVKVDQILLDIHTFLLTHPDQMWKNRADDTPLRTIKTILYTLGKLKKQEILDCLGLIDDPESSEVAAYLKKILKSSGRKATENHVNGSDSTTPHKSSVPDLLMGIDGGNKAQNKEKINDKLAEIFAKIGSKENTREGLAELYDFKQKYPEADIDPFLKRTSEFFQSYIERGLKNIEMERKGRKVSGTAPSSGISTTALSSSKPAEEESTDDADAYRDRLKVLRMRAGLDNQSNTASKKAESGDQRVPEYEEPSTDERSLSAADKKPSYINIPSVISQSTDTTDSITADPDSILDIKKRLERIKNNSRN